MRFETVVASLLVLVGLLCLTMSGTYMISDDLENILTTFIQLCIWMGIPAVIAGIIFLLVKKRKGE